MFSDNDFCICGHMLEEHLIMEMVWGELDFGWCLAELPDKCTCLKFRKAGTYNDVTDKDLGTQTLG